MECSFGASPLDRLYKDLAQKAPLLSWRGDMANGQVVLLTTEGLSGGPPMRTSTTSPKRTRPKRRRLLRRSWAPNEKVHMELLPKAAVEALGLKAGEFRSA